MIKHKVFISYHHEKDEHYKTEFERKCQDIHNKPSGAIWRL